MARIAWDPPTPEAGAEKAPDPDQTRGWNWGQVGHLSFRYPSEHLDLSDSAGTIRLRHRIVFADPETCPEFAAGDTLTDFAMDLELVAGHVDEHDPGLDRPAPGAGWSLYGGPLGSRRQQLTDESGCGTSRWYARAGAYQTLVVTYHLPRRTAVAEAASAENDMPPGYIEPAAARRLCELINRTLVVGYGGPGQPPPSTGTTGAFPLR